MTTSLDRQPPMDRWCAKRGSGVHGCAKACEYVVWPSPESAKMHARARSFRHSLRRHSLRRWGTQEEEIGATWTNSPPAKLPGSVPTLRSLARPGYSLPLRLLALRFLHPIQVPLDRPNDVSAHDLVGIRESLLPFRTGRGGGRLGGRKGPNARHISMAPLLKPGCLAPTRRGETLHDRDLHGRLERADDCGGGVWPLVDSEGLQEYVCSLSTASPTNACSASWGGETSPWIRVVSRRKLSRINP